MRETHSQATMGARGASPVRRAASPPRSAWLRPLPVTAMTLLAATLLVSLLGCGPVGWMAHSVSGGQKRVPVPAEYEGLEGQRVAVLVAVDEYTLHQHRQAPLLICRSVSSQLAEHVPGTALVNPRDVMAFQHENPYWATDRYGHVIEALDVDRLVVVDLMDYRLHEPGNRHVWQGLLSATVLVTAADARDPDQPAYSASVRVRFPEQTELGSVNAEAQTIEAGMIERFSVAVGRLFHDHEVWQ
ncbi:MAG: hypothetical protein WD534_01865 [Phycisphaeraceae bacterium]